ncbi:hypothetical protein KSP40_PGU008392 [Platanthera guangdongensis]|uniref:RNase H type-1 domain-containing protein n=1 Tax=Platanthera guangdongensis TaxID=2320717 RepID=A0ABR2M2L0_9ASPA
MRHVSRAPPRNLIGSLGWTLGLVNVFFGGDWHRMPSPPAAGCYDRISLIRLRAPGAAHLLRTETTSCESTPMLQLSRGKSTGGGSTCLLSGTGRPSRLLLLRHTSSICALSACSAMSCTSIGGHRMPKFMGGSLSRRWSLQQLSWRTSPTLLIFHLRALFPNNKAGIGIIVCNHRGVVQLAAGSGLSHWDPWQVELAALLSLCRLLTSVMLRAKGIIIEGDCKNVLDVCRTS